jgi:hypothetical protein
MEATCWKTMKIIVNNLDFKKGNKKRRTLTM